MADIAIHEQPSTVLRNILIEQINPNYIYVPSLIKVITVKTLHANMELPTTKLKKVTNAEGIRQTYYSAGKQS